VKRSAAVLALLLAACSGGGSQKVSQTPYDPKSLPSGPVGESIRYGHDIFVNTQTLMKGYVRAGMSCAACHLDAGTKPRGGTLVGVYGRFPQWNKRSHRVIALQDRIAECFLYSMNGHPPAYSSREMVALVAYMAWLSRGSSIGGKQPAGESFIVPLPQGAPNAAHGAALYAQRCAACHQANGGGVAGAFPPLWGPASFNKGAGMAHLNRMTGFVRFNMPQNAPGSLSLQDAYDVSGFVLSHARPEFQGGVLVGPSPEPARYF
jgi:thiosulfate dehydrogenase